MRRADNKIRSNKDGIRKGKRMPSISYIFFAIWILCDMIIKN